MEGTEQIIKRARADLARRLGIDESKITLKTVEQTNFPDAALGAPVEEEMSAQMITPGWRVRLGAQSETYEYRSNGKQLRLANYKGENHRI